MYNIINLSKNDFTCKINLSLGANLISLRYKQDKILREPDYTKPLDNPYLYGMPILFPVNRIEGGRFTFEGREYVFPINEEKTGCHLHGDLHQTPFTLKSKSSSSLVCLYKATKLNPYLNFQHEFEVEIEYKIVAHGVKIKTTFKNNSKLNMPIFLGYHTTFNAHENSFVKVDASFEFERNNIYLPTGKTLAFDDVTNNLINGEFKPLSTSLSKHYKCKKHGKIAIFNKSSNYTMQYINSKNLSFRLIYGECKDFICLEPQTCLANAANSPFSRNDSGFTYIKPNKKMVFNSFIKIVKGDKR